MVTHVRVRSGRGKGSGREENPWGHAGVIADGLHNGPEDVREPARAQGAEEKEAPGRIEADLATGEFKAPRLIELPSNEEVEKAEDERINAHGIQAFPIITASGLVKVTTPAKVRIPPVEDTEAFRYRIDLLEMGVDFAKIKNPNHTILSTASKEMWTDHKEHILVDTVLLFETRDEDDTIITGRPSFGLVMSYEYKIRCRAAELMSGEDGPPRDMKRAFAEA